MKRILAFCLALAALISCEDTTPVEDNGGTITVTPAEVVFGIDGGKEYLTLTLKSDVKQWELVQKDGTDWCVVSAQNGRTSTTLSVTVPEYLGSPRTSVLEFTSPGCEPAVVKVIQRGISTDPMPSGTEPGINYNEDGTVTLAFRDRDVDGNSHDYAYLIGEFNDWKTSSEYIMNWDDASGCWWYTMTDIVPADEYMFQYYLGNRDEEKGRAYADPYSEIIYEPYDSYISGSTYPGLRDYPSATRGAVSAFRVNRTEYAWAVPDFKIEDPDDLVIYELHFRDFTETGDIKGAMKKMDYIQALGVNAVELMPIHEFDGSDSWGYNPIAFFALEKSYGTREMYKQFIDECHKRGMAVIIDVVYNHAHENHPMAGLYFDWSMYKPTANNPWFNVAAPHPHSVFHDFNHENAQVREYVKKSLKYLLDEYKVDGFRFDLTKGFTQKASSSDAQASAYDATRVAILKDYCSYVKSLDQNAVVIFEHFADSENSDLAKAGAKVWRKCNWEYRNAVLGGSDNFGNIWTGNGDLFGAYVGYMESHDEERICFGAVKNEESSSVSWGICGTITGWSSDITMTEDKPFFVAKGVALGATDMFKIRGNKSWNDAYNYGAATKGYKLPKNSGYSLTLGASSQDMAAPAAGTYDIYFSPAAGKVWLMEPGKRPSESEVPVVEQEDPLVVAMRRAGAAAAFCFMVPGPKMIWQFGELGYDESIEVNGRTGRKPLHWEYYDVPARKALYDTYAGLLRFRKENPRFFDKNASFSWTSSGTIKTIRCTADGKSFFVVGNFAKGIQTASVTLPSAGTWTNWFDSSEKFTGASQTFKLKGGEFKMLVN